MPIVLIQVLVVHVYVVMAIMEMVIIANQVREKIDSVFKKCILSRLVLTQKKV